MKTQRNSNYRKRLVILNNKELNALKGGTCPPDPGGQSGTRPKPSVN